MVLLTAALVLLGIIGPLGVVLGSLLAGVAALTAVVFEVRERIQRSTKELRNAVNEHRLAQIGKDPLDLEQELQEQVQAMVSEVPTVVIVDDASWADDEVVEFVDSLLRMEAPVLIVATDGPIRSGTCSKRGLGFGRVARDFGGKCRYIRLEPLAEDALIQIIRKRAQETDFKVARAIARHSRGNPLVLGGILDSPLLEDSLDGDAYNLTDIGVLDDIPSDVEGTFVGYWSRLPKDLKQVLAVATLHGLHVQPDTVAIGFAEATQRSADPLLKRARDVVSWLRRIDDHLDRFADPAFLSIAVERKNEALPKARLEIARHAMIRGVAAWRDSGDWVTLSAEAKRVLLRVHVTAAIDGFETPDRSAAKSALALASLEGLARQSHWSPVRRVCDSLGRR